MRTYYLELIVHTNYLVIIDRDFQYQHHLNLAERLFLSCKMLKKTGIKKPYSKKSVIENCVFCDIAQRSKNHHANTHYYLLQFIKTHCAKYLNRNRRSGNCSTQCKSKFLNQCGFCISLSAIIYCCIGAIFFDLHASEIMP